MFNIIENILAKRNEKLDRLTNTREEMLKKKQKEAEEQKKRTLAMYDNMAKSAPAGGDKKLDIGVYKSFDGKVIQKVILC